MKNQPKILSLLIQCLIPGLLGLLLRGILYRTGFDDKGIYYNGELLENQNTTKFSKAGTYTFQIETPYATDGKRTVNVTILKKKVSGVGLHLEGKA